MKDRDRSTVQDDQSLRGSTAWKKKPADSPVPIGTLLEPFLTKRKPHLERETRIVRAWEDAVPEILRAHCTLAGFNRGVVIVEAEAGPFFHQMQMIRSQVLSDMKTDCPMCGLREIRILPGVVRRAKAQT